MQNMSNPKVENPNIIAQLFGQLYNSKASQDAMTSMYEKLGGESAISPDDFKAAQNVFSENPLSVGKVSLGDKSTRPIWNTAQLLGSNIKAHPFKAGGTALNAGLNLAGLFNDDKWLGQALGTAAGVIVPKSLGMGFGPLGAVNAAMLGGNIGSLFDTLSSKAERDSEEQARLAKMPAEYTTY